MFGWKKKKSEAPEAPKPELAQIAEILMESNLRLCAALEAIKTEMSFQNSMLALRTIYLDSQGYQMKDETGEQRVARKINNLARMLSTAQSYLDYKLQETARNMMGLRQSQLDGLKALKKNFLLGTFNRMLAYLEPHRAGDTVADKNFEAHLFDDIVMLKKRAEESPTKIEAPDEFYPRLGVPYAKEVEEVIGRLFQIEKLPEELVEELSALRIGILGVLNPSGVEAQNK